MSFPPQLDTPFVLKDRNNEITIHVPPTRLKGCHHSLPKQIEPTHGGYQPPCVGSTKFEPNLSFGLACTLGYNFFAGVCVIARGTCQVQPIGLKPALSSFRRSGASKKYSPSRLARLFRLQRRKCLDRKTYIHINTGRQTFSSDPPEEIFEQKPSMLKH